MASKSPEPAEEPALLPAAPELGPMGCPGVSRDIALCCHDITLHCHDSPRSCPAACDLP